MSPFNNRNQLSVAALIVVVILLMVGLSYASVPLYRIFCQMTGYGGTAQITDHISNVVPDVVTRLITIKFNTDISSSLQWKFIPLQKEMKVVVGESGLAFFEAENLTDKSITGISTYNVTPQQAAIYFNKIQCFCFDEQLLKPHESIQMPVLFFIDPDFLRDPKVAEVDTITLSYTFFKSEEFNTQNLNEH